ncbi:MAG: flippase-like domain-containing protein [Verrucomicrobia bacterium]|nr:flippase-like domain-containing protein [Verrucomicrobiota bacterium]
MKRKLLLRLTAYLLAFCGLALFTALLIREGVQDVGGALAAAGWGVAAIVAFHLVQIGLDTASWRLVFPRRDRLHFRTTYWMRWIGESISNLAPAAQLGGDLVRARLAVVKGVPVASAAASVLIDITLGVFTQTIFTLLALGLLIAATGQSNLWGPAIAGAPIAFAAVGGFYVVQRLGMFRLCAAIISRCSKDPKWQGMMGKGGEIDQTLKAIYSDRKSIAICALFEMMSWFAGAFEVWIGLQALGVGGGFGRGVILEGIGQGLRSAMFFIPGALGIQEGGYLIVGGLLGIPGETALALALIRRVRELSLGIPGLVVWQAIEGSRAWKNNAARIADEADNLSADTVSGPPPVSDAG